MTQLSNDAAPRVMPSRRRFQLVILGLSTTLLLAAGGCEPKTKGIVTGTVTVDGQPAKQGGITFIPVDGQSSTEGAMIVDGKYTAEVPFGEAKVQVRVSKQVGQQKLYDTPDSPVQPIMQEMLPDKYNEKTELRLEVKPGTTEQNYDLKSK